MIKWKTVSKETALRNDYMSVTRAAVELPNGVVSDYLYLDSPGTVMVIPIKPSDNPDGHTYVMVRQYRYPVGSYDLEFPAGRREPGESVLDAALRELKQETGYSAKEIKLLYSMYMNPGGSNGTTAICLALVDTSVEIKQDLDLEEAFSALKVEDVSPSDLHKKILSMDISDPHTLAAIAVFVMNSQSATKYLAGSSEEE